jgi:hypothetical protein
MTALNNFKNAFLTANGQERAQIIYRTVKANEKDTRIGNLLQMIDLNNTKLDKKMKSDNIHFICIQLAAFPDFAFVSA